MSHDSRLARFLVALIAAVLAFLLRMATDSVLGPHGQWLIFVLAVAISAWFGGLKPGLLTAFPLLLTGLFFNGGYSDGDVTPAPGFSAALFAVTSFAICSAMQRLRMAQFTAQESTTQLHEVLESTHDAILSVNSEFHCLYANSRAGQIARKRPALLYGKSLRVIFPETPSVQIYRELHRCLRERAPVRFEDKLEASGRWYQFDAYPSPSGLNLFVRDVTAKKSEEAARETAALEQLRLESILLEMPVGIIIASSDWKIEFVNQAASEMFGEKVVPGVEFTGFQGELKTLSGERMDPEYLPMRQSLRSGKRQTNVEVEYVRPDGRSTTLIINSLPLLRRDGTLRGVLCTYSDVSSIRQMQKALALSEARLRRLFDSPIIGVISGSGESILDANDAFLSMLGYTREDLAPGRLKWNEITPPGFEDRDARAIRQLSSRGFTDPFEKEFLRKDGTAVPVLMAGAAYDKGDWSPWISWVVDRSEHQALENRLREAAKLESIGLLAGGIAHDFNNILTSILGNASLAFESLPAENGSRELLENAIRSTERAADLTRQLLAYAGKGRFVVKPTNVVRLVGDIGELIRSSIPRNVDLDLRFEPLVPTVLADRTQLRQLIMNLVINGAEAVGERAGLVQIRVGKVTVTEPGVELISGEYACIEVQDSGCGMDDETRLRIFDPFFTTKFTGRGLGLAAANGIVRTHKGSIRVSSAPGEGSTFTVLLPATQDQVALELPELSETTEPIGAGTILVVDDDTGIRDVARNSLERYGYTVVSASNGKEALDIYRGLSHSISMVLLDLTMPKMSGEETLENLLNINPAVKVLLSSGFDRTETGHRLADKGVAGFIQKPFTASELASRVQEILSS